MNTENRMNKGKAIEFYLIHELLKNDFDVFTPVIDTGVDLIIKDRSGGFVEVQVKSRMIKEDRYGFRIKEFLPKENFFIVCHNIDKNEFFVMPSIIFHRKSTKKTNGLREMKYDIIKKYEDFRNDKGLELLKRALDNPNNKISRAL